MPYNRYLGREQCDAIPASDQDSLFNMSLYHYDTVSDRNSLSHISMMRRYPVFISTLLNLHKLTSPHKAGWPISFRVLAKIQLASDLMHGSLSGFMFSEMQCCFIFHSLKLSSSVHVGRNKPKLN